MIKPDRWIKAEAEQLGVNPEFINPASVDVVLGGHIVEYHYADHGNGSTEQITRSYDLLPGESFTFRPGYFYLAHTEEFTRLPRNVCAQLILKSSSGRKGLDHAHSGWGDPGFHGQWTFEFVAHIPATFQVGQRIAQLVFMGVDGTVDQSYGELSTSHYQGQTGVTEARS